MGRLGTVEGVASLHHGSYRKKRILIQVLYLIFQVAGLPIDQCLLLFAMRKKIVVLGGSSGIGKATAERFAREGWKVLVAAPDLSQCLTTVNTLEGKDHVACEVDVRRHGYLNNLRQTVKEKFGSFDTLVNSIGISQSHPVIDSDFSAWDNSLQVMLYGSVKACRVLVPLLKDGGRIIHVTSIHYERVANGSSAYGTAKLPSSLPVAIGNRTGTEKYPCQYYSTGIYKYADVDEGRWQK